MGGGSVGAQVLGFKGMARGSVRRERARGQSGRLQRADRRGRRSRSWEGRDRARDGAAALTARACSCRSSSSPPTRPTRRTRRGGGRGGARRGRSGG